LPSNIFIVTFKTIEISKLIETFKHKTVTIEVINSAVAAQVYQRNLGIAAVKTKFIIQCDDDICMLFNSLEQLHKASLAMDKTVCSARVITPDGNSFYKKNYLFALLCKVVFCIFNLRWPRNAFLISKSGRNYAPLTLDPLCENEWLPSCLMYKREIFKLAITYTDRIGKGN
jgi:hypothetical protein